MEKRSFFANYAPRKNIMIRLKNLLPLLLIVSAAFMLIADDEDRDHANRKKALQLGEQWRAAGYHVISMRDDFKTIYGEQVKVVPFTFED